MKTEAMINWNFFPQNEDPQAVDLKWGFFTAEDVVPTGRWRIIRSEYAITERNMEIEVKYTRVSKGTLQQWEFSENRFLRFLKIKYVKNIKKTFRQTHQIAWVNETQVGYRTVTTFVCGED